MKIVYLSGAVLPSRTANSIHIMKMCQAFAVCGHDVTLFAHVKNNTDYDDVFNHYGIEQKFEIQPLINTGLPYFGHVNGLIMALKAWKSKPDFIIGRHPTGCYFAVKAQIPTFFEIHGPINAAGRTTNRLFNKMIASDSFQRLIVITHSLKKYYEAHFPILKDKILVLPDGADPIDADSIPGAGVRKGGKLNIGYTGHLYSGKGMEIISQLVKSMGSDHFHIVGGTEEDIAYWKNKIGNHSNVSFHGFQPHSKIPCFLKDFDVVLLPNQPEVFGNVKKDIGQWTSPLKLFEYMAAGKAIICSDLPVLREVVEHENNALLCPPGDIEAWENAVIRLKSDKLLKDKIRNTAYQDFYNNYTWYKRSENILKCQ